MSFYRRICASAARVLQIPIRGRKQNESRAPRKTKNRQSHAHGNPVFPDLLNETKSLCEWVQPAPVRAQRVFDFRDIGGLWIPSPHGSSAGGGCQFGLWFNRDWHFDFPDAFDVSKQFAACIRSENAESNSRSLFGRTDTDARFCLSNIRQDSGRSGRSGCAMAGAKNFWLVDRSG
jgi:hypothetical protein